MFMLENGLTLIDTPGMRELGLLDAEGGVRDTFPDIEALAAHCRYSNCTHGKEPGCAVREAVEQHYISESRYTSYLNILEDREEGKYRAPF